MSRSARPDKRQGQTTMRSLPLALVRVPKEWV